MNISSFSFRVNFIYFLFHKSPVLFALHNFIILSNFSWKSIGYHEDFSVYGCVCNVFSVSARSVLQSEVHIPSWVTYNVGNMVFCVSEWPPFHLEVWCQVKLMCSFLNSPATVHTYNDEILRSFLLAKWLCPYLKDECAEVVNFYFLLYIIYLDKEWL